MLPACLTNNVYFVLWTEETRKSLQGRRLSGLNGFIVQRKQSTTISREGYEKERMVKWVVALIGGKNEGRGYEGVHEDGK